MESFINNNKITVLSSDNSPYRFTITIKEECVSTDDPCSFNVTGQDNKTNLQKTKSYTLPDRQHSSYLNFFEQLANDYGLRLPQNRKPIVRHSFKWRYKELLCKNLSPDMLYGYGDPAVIRVEENSQNEVWYYMVTTSNDAPNSFPICRSQNLTKWEFVGFVFPKGNKPEWAADGKTVSDFWAPEIHQIGKEFRVYFAARDKITLELCIGMATASNITGPFVALRKPIIKGNSIDPHICKGDNENVYLFWKKDNNGIWPSLLINLIHLHPEIIEKIFIEKQDIITASFIQTLWPWIEKLKPMESFMVQQVFIESVTSAFWGFTNQLRNIKKHQTLDIKAYIDETLHFMKTPVFAQKLSTDGSHLEGTATEIIQNDKKWEGHLVEGIWVTEYHKRYYLFYSANDFSTDLYGVGVAIADKILGPYHKMPKQLLKSTNKWLGPGHPSVILDTDGKHQLFLHAFYPKHAGYKEFRALLSVSLKFLSDQVVIL